MWVRKVRYSPFFIAGNGQVLSSNENFALKIETKSNILWEFELAFPVLLSESQYSKGTHMTYIGVPFEY